jgi:hypothetical protein
MQRFQFNLETVLRWRESQVNLEENKLRALFAEQETLRAALLQLEEAETAERARVASPEAWPAERESLPPFLRWAASERARLAAAQRDTETKIAAQRARLTEARRSHELLARLKDDRLAEWKKAETKELEDLAAEAHLARWNHHS